VRYWLQFCYFPPSTSPIVAFFSLCASIAIDTAFGVAGKGRTDFGHTDFEQPASALFSLAGEVSPNAAASSDADPVKRVIIVAAALLFSAKGALCSRMGSEPSIDTP
jgi:hypothetical protein